MRPDVDQITRIQIPAAQARIRSNICRQGMASKWHLAKAELLRDDPSKFRKYVRKRSKRPKQDTFQELPALIDDLYAQIDRDRVAWGNSYPAGDFSAYAAERSKTHRSLCLSEPALLSLRALIPSSRKTDSHQLPASPRRRRKCRQRCRGGHRAHAPTSPCRLYSPRRGTTRRLATNWISREVNSSHSSIGIWPSKPPNPPKTSTRPFPTHPGRPPQSRPLLRTQPTLCLPRPTPASASKSRWKRPDHNLNSNLHRVPTAQRPTLEFQKNLLLFFQLTSHVYHFCCARRCFKGE